MEAIIVVVIVVIIIIIKQITKKRSESNNNEMDISVLPYKVNDDFLTDTEYSFYKLLKLSLEGKAVICPKVGLKDIFFIGKGVGNDYMKYFGKIAQKHVDFLLCNPDTMKPICAVELDDASHTTKKSIERDLFVEKVFKDADFKLIRISSVSDFSLSKIQEIFDDIINIKQSIQSEITDNTAVICPKCKIPMLLRKSTKGENAGKEFYGCVNYPRCKEIVNINTETMKNTNENS